MAKIEEQYVSTEFKLRCVEIAVSTVTNPYTSPPSSGIKFAGYQDKPLREIFDRADRIMQYCLNDEIPSSLIDKLRSVLCDKNG
jgi:hypothetical protein